MRVTIDVIKLTMQKPDWRMRRLVAADLVPGRAGQPVKAWVHLSLADLLLLDGGSALQEQWTAQVRARWAACRAFASQTGSEGGAWLDGHPVRPAARVGSDQIPIEASCPSPTSAPAT